MLGKIVAVIVFIAVAAGIWAWTNATGYGDNLCQGGRYGWSPSCPRPTTAVTHQGGGGR